MAAPKLTTQYQGLGAVTADMYNTYEQTCDTISQIQNFVGTQGVQVYVRGFVTPNDGGQGPFYWNASYVGSGDGINTVVPYGTMQGGQGAWVRLGYDNPAPGYSYLVPVTGFSYTIPFGITTVLLNPAGTLATGSITLPVPWRDGMLITLESTQAITSLTVSASAGTTLVNPPNSLAAGTAIGFMYVQSISSWITVAATLGISGTTGTGLFVLAGSPTITTPNIIGVTNGTAAAAGSVGELVSAAVGSVSLTSSTPQTIASINLSPGMWEVSATFQTGAGGSTIPTSQGAVISSANNTLSAINADAQAFLPATTDQGGSTALPVGPTIVNITSQTIYYLVAECVFTGGALTGGGLIKGLRVR